MSAVFKNEPALHVHFAELEGGVAADQLLRLLVGNANGNQITSTVANHMPLAIGECKLQVTLADEFFGQSIRMPTP